MASSARFDLNLLSVILAIHDAGSVSGAGKQLGMSQPATSAALNRLRKRFGDELFVRTATGMEATPRALALIEPAREIMARVNGDVLKGDTFDPRTTRTEFTFAMSDIGEMVFYSRLLAHLQREAPHATLSAVTAPAQDIAEGLESGRIDLAIGHFPDIRKHNFYQQRLFTHSFSCILRKGHPIRGNRLTQAQFMALGHAVIRAEVRSQEVFEQFLKQKRIERRIVSSTPHFMTIPFIVSSSDLVATVPNAIAQRFAEMAEVKVMTPPFEMPRFDLKQHWHRKSHQDPKNAWLRSQVVALFHNDKRWDGASA
ncbi:transcriptional regulator, LysR family [Noviherbaspirillum humi]|uniref:Transcriptional regulator, LysR family n=1 Tax=Noviherbaspirillum humi TaxID=1688639 RepID=A0A239LVI3_9BURK|nr:LysR family transcriptional regulator [Noviherbaspirillum humi]SNT34471.1 transcriptional regulator, LysR family [Noviherbaspirillum humi]